MGAGFSTEESIRALEMCGTVPAAMEYLEATDADEESNGLFNANPQAVETPVFSQPTHAM